MESQREKFEMRRYHHLLTSLGTKVAIGELLTKKDIHDIKKGVALFKKIGYTNGAREFGALLKQSLKNKKRSHLTLI